MKCEIVGVGLKHIKDMMVGQLGEVCHDYEPHIVIKTFDRLVSLTDPHITWIFSNAPKIKLYPFGTKAEYTS